MRLLLVMLLILFVTACVAEPQLENTTPQGVDQEPLVEESPEAPSDVVPPDNEAEPQSPPPSSPPEELETPDDQDFLVSNEAITVVSCDPEQRAVRLLIKNTGEKRWIFAGNVPWPTPPDVLDTELFFNNYEASRDRPYYDPATQERLFGPGESFPENCGGVEALDPGEEMACELAPVPLVPLGGPIKNKVRISSPEASFPVEFDCE